MRASSLLRISLCVAAGACSAPPPKPALKPAPATAPAAATATPASTLTPTLRPSEVETAPRAAQALLRAAREARAANDLDAARARTAEGIDALLADEAALAEKPGTDLLAELGDLASDLGDLPAAERARRKVVELRSKSMRTEDPDLLAARQALGITLFQRGDIAGARALFQEVLDVESRVLPEDHPDLQKARASLAIAMKASGDLRGAREIEEKVLAIDERTLKEDDADLQKARQNLAMTLESLGDLRRARELEEKVLEVRTRTLPDDDLQLQAIRGNLAVTIEAMGDLEGARALEAKVLEVFAKKLPTGHPDIQRARLNLAMTQYTLGDLAGARTLLEGVVAAFSKTLPEDHPDLQGARMNLAIVIEDLGDVAGARALEEQALEADARRLPDDHPDLQLSRATLASTLRNVGDHQAARDLQEKVLEIDERTLPPDHPDLQKARSNLAFTLTEMGDHARARELEEKVLEVRTRLLPDGHPALLRAQNSLGVTMGLQGDREGALAMFEQVYTKSAKNLPSDHPDLEKVRENLASTLAAVTANAPAGDRGNEERARRFDELVREYVRGLRESSRKAIAESSSREAEERVASAGDELSTALSLAKGVGVLGDDADREREVFLLSETMRGAALSSARLARAARSDPEYEAIRARARAASTKLATSAHGGSSVEEFARARAELEDAERELVRIATALPGSPGKALDPDFDALATSVHGGQAFVGYRRYRRTKIARGGPAGGASVESLCAFVLRPGGKLSRVELGAVAPIEDAVARWREAISVDTERGVSADPGRSTRVESRGAELRALVFDPLAPALAGADRVLVAPDDVLHAIALDALPAPTGSEPLGSKIRFETRSSLLELLAEKPARTGETSLLAMGDASFNSPPAPFEGKVDGKAEEAPVVSQASIRAPSASGVLRGGAWERGFAVLPETRAEVAAIGETFSEVFGEKTRAIVLERREASRENLFRIAPSARFLHIATHGWFAPDSIRSVEDSSPLDPQSGLGPRTTTEERVRGMAPMLLSGVALAGANLPADPTGRIPGLVTAEELATLDLSGCELAVLSACDTNVGVRRGGQGVASLQRALHQAGARSVITSIWRVPDEATMELMTDFYRRMWVGKEPKSRALWEAKMKIRGAKDEAGAPRYSVRDWAGWVLTGDPD